jgi:hypothetical protein
VSQRNGGVGGNLTFSTYAPPGLRGYVRIPIELTSLKPEAARSLFPRLIDRNHHFWRLMTLPRISTRRTISTASARGPQRKQDAPRVVCLDLTRTLGLLRCGPDRKGIRFWNLTLYTITSFQMSPAGKDSWGPDQCKNDRDGTVDHDERLRITGIEPGRYDVKSPIRSAASA